MPEIRRLFAWADIEAVETTYTIGEGTAAAELIVSRVAQARERGLFES